MLHPSLPPQILNWPLHKGAVGEGAMSVLAPLTWMTTRVSWHCSRKRKHFRMP